MFSNSTSFVIRSVRLVPEYARLREELAMGRKTLRQKTAAMPFLVNGISDSALLVTETALAEDLLSDSGTDPVLILTASDSYASRLTEFLRAAGLSASLFPGRDLNFYNITASHEAEQERLSVLMSILDGSCRCIVSTPDAALSYTVPRAYLAASVRRIAPGDIIPIEKLCAVLAQNGYRRVGLVEGAGQFALRGGILDVYPVRGVPFRAEFFDDELDRLGALDVLSQRVSENLTEAVISPMREFLADSAARERLISLLGKTIRKVNDADAADTLKGELACVESLPPAGGDLAFADKYASVIYPDPECLLDYLGASATVLYDDSAAQTERIEASSKLLRTQIESMIADRSLPVPAAEHGFDRERLDLFFEKSILVQFETFPRAGAGKRLAGIYPFPCKHTVSYLDRYPLLLEELAGYLRGGWKVIVLTDGEAAIAPLADSLRADGLEVLTELYESAEFLPEPGILLAPADFPLGGFELMSAHIAVVSLLPDGSTVRRGRIRKPAKHAKNAGEKILSYAELSEGDIVVHTQYGIGRYEGIENLTVAGVSRDYIKIAYDGTDRLFLPVDQMDNISKYIGAHADDGLVRLSKMGGTEWKKASARAKAATKQMAAELIRLYAERKRRPGYAFPPDDDLCREFNDSFEYEETDGQLQAEQEIKADMEQECPMDRLLCGDVGYGKTEVALRAAMKCILAGKQVALLVPTTILAFQHYQTVQSRMQPFSVRTDMLCRFRSPKEQDAILRRLARGDLDLVIGTHRLLSGDVKFMDLGLLIIDEEQRFGVAQKEKIKKVAAGVDVLSLSATPIPRTLNMAMSGIRDMSILDEAPGDRLPVQTYVLEHDDMIIAEAIRKELRRGGQVFYLYNKIESIDRCAAKIAAAVPDARIAIAHGQMDKDQLEDIWQSIVLGEIDVLVSTTIIETGVDVPNANTLIIEDADRLGLSQLHQIRGRVGRSHRRAYAYFTYPRGKTLTEISQKRLSAIREYAEFGAGFRIALRDLEIRGAGNVLGAEQHGHLDAVGYDMYIKLLNEAILEEKGETVPQHAECKIDLPFDAFLPDHYIAYSAQRMEMYKKIASVRNEADCDDVCDELCDRYGELPRAALTLCRISLLRALGEQAGFSSISMPNDSVTLVPQSIDPQIWMEMHAKYPRIRIVMHPQPCVTYKPARKSDTTDELIRFVSDYLSKLPSASPGEKGTTK